MKKLSPTILSLLIRIFNLVIILSFVTGTGHTQHKMEDRTKVKLVGLDRHKKIGVGYLLNKSDNSVRLFNPTTKKQVEYTIEGIGSISLGQI